MKLAPHKKRFGYIWKIAGTVIILIIVSCSVTISSLVQPATVNGGDILPVTINGSVYSQNAQASNLMVAILVPKLWNAAANTTMTFTSQLTAGEQPMSAIPAGTPSPGGGGLDWPTDLMNTIGHAGNLIPEYEWVAFYSNSPVSIGSNVTVSFTVNIQIRVAPNSIYFNMAYCVAESTDGLHQTFWGSQNPPTSYYNAFSPSPITVNGTGSLLDFVNPQLSVVTPSTSLDNDIITLPFNAQALTNPLSNAAQVYLCATGYTSAGDSIQVCQQTAATRLDSLGQGNWQIALWPRGFFHLSAGQTLDSLHYFFTDQTGTIQVGNKAGSTPFSYTFNCQ